MIKHGARAFLLLLGINMAAFAQTLIVGGSTLNGDFNAGPGANVSFSNTPEWYNLAGVQTAQCTRDNLAYDGSQNAVVSSNVLFGLDTGYAIVEGDVFSISYVWRDAWNWVDAVGQIKVNLFVTDDDTLTGTQTILITGWSGTSTQDSTYETVNYPVIYAAHGAVAGKTLFLSIGTDAAGFARIDNFELKTRVPETYYVSAAGNNLNDGLSQASAWQNVDALDGRTFGPGDQILFKRGDTFTGATALLGSGSSNGVITISAYGTGDRPRLTGDAAESAVFLLTDNEYIEFQNLHLSNFNTNNASVPERQVIRVDVPAGSGEISHLHFRNLRITNVQGYGRPIHEDDHRSYAIHLKTAGDDAYGDRFNDVLCENCTFADIDGRGFSLNDGSQSLVDWRNSGTPYFPSTNCVFQYNYGTNIYRNMAMTTGTDGFLMQYNTMDTTVEGSAYWPFNCANTLVQHNLFMNLYADDADAYVCHFDYQCIGTIMQYNVGINVAGGLIEYIVNTASWSFQENGIARYNIGIDVGWRNKENGAGMLLTGDVTGGQFYNNTIVQVHSNMTHGISFKNWGGGWPTNNMIYNNVFYAGGTNAVAYNNPARFDDLGNTVSNNLFYGNISPPFSAVSSIIGDPLFFNPAGSSPEDFKVRYGSAAISAGVLASDNGGIDFFGNEVSSNALPSVGFHEYQTDGRVDSDGDKMVDQWEIIHSLNPTNPIDAMIDIEPDGLKNLAEFALGGNPRDGEDVGYAPSYGVVDVGGGTTRFFYIYPRRTDWQELGLDYDLGASTNLVTGPWVDWAHWIPGVGAEGYGPGFDSVTNYFSLDNGLNQRFIRLEMQ